MQGWETGDSAGYVIGQDLGKGGGGASPPRRSPGNQLNNMLTKSKRSRATSRLKSAQGKVLRAIRVQRRMSAVANVRQKARSNWAGAKAKMETVMGFKWLGTESVRRRKRSIFGNVRGGPVMDDSSMPRVSLHDTPEGSETPQSGARSLQNRRGSNVASMVLQARPTPAPSPYVDEREAAKNRRMVTNRRETQATAESVEKTMKAKALKKKMKGAVGKVRKFVRVVRLSYSDTFTGTNKVSLTDLLGRLRSHYDPDGIHADPHDGQHEFYTDLALLQRESLKHDPRVRRKLTYSLTCALPLNLYLVKHHNTTTLQHRNNTSKNVTPHLHIFFLDFFLLDLFTI